MKLTPDRKAELYLLPLLAAVEVLGAPPADPSEALRVSDVSAMGQTALALIAGLAGEANDETEDSGLTSEYREQLTHWRRHLRAIAGTHQLLLSLATGEQARAYHSAEIARVQQLKARFDAFLEDTDPNGPTVH